MAKLKLEATTLVSNLLSDAGDTGFHLMSESELPEAMKSHQVVWTDKGGIGFFDIIPETKSLSKLEQLSATVISNAASTCKNNFASESMGAPRSDARQLKTTCVKDDGSGPTMLYTLLDRDGEAFWLFGYYGVQNAGAAEESEHKLRDAVLAKYGER